MRCRIDSLACLVFAFAFAASGITRTAHGQASSTKKPGTEADAENAYNAAVKQGPTALYGFLESFPKGADLHVHLLAPSMPRLSFAMPARTGCAWTQPR